MALAEVDYLNGGGGGSEYGSLNVTAGETVTVPLNFTPKKILLVQTNPTSQTYTSWTYFYDEDYSTTKMCFCGGNTSYSSWNDFNFSDVGNGTSGFIEVSNGFKFVNGSRDGFRRIDYIAIR